MRHGFCLIVATLLLASRITAQEAERDEPIRGVVISCQTWGREWGTDEMVEAMREIKALGANWVQIHPYGSVTREGAVSFGRLPETSANAPVWLARPIAEAHRLGLKVCITPHLAPWRAGWGWRGDVRFETRAQWDRFFADYREWITRLARLCRDADGFTVGSELDRTIPGHEREWRDIIAAVRAETAAPLTYAANWPDYRRVPFWDALDVIGLSAYFPLVDHDRPPTAAEIDATWRRIRGDVLTYAARQQKRVVFMELGYDTGLNAAREPWRDGDGQPGGGMVQALCLDRALAAMEVPDDLIGAFLWKWFPGNSRGENFLVSDPHMREVVARHWRAQPE
ncbi:glycoside hydrolase family 113 [Synoicihabitans lomoniglobus]|uniref:Uncharacterized protein n=1 Tax=Synoicihabitans lomoniglobus TaxID=2909285 RepID=A0AAE9ZWU7_9BACT|nr:hypothetical protein [Opitutaceae bacterium LMO-M01]WED64345.1 hypothetical protein PXH66_18560 [Opitutaceae bacterium LMO-M01]